VDPGLLSFDDKVQPAANIPTQRTNASPLNLCELFTMRRLRTGRKEENVRIR
jgi:hypothetical protein